MHGIFSSFLLQTISWYKRCCPLPSDHIHKPSPLLQYNKNILSSSHFLYPFHPETKNQIHHEHRKFFEENLETLRLAWGCPISFACFITKFIHLTFAAHHCRFRFRRCLCQRWTSWSPNCLCWSWTAFHPSRKFEFRKSFPARQSICPSSCLRCRRTTCSKLLKRFFNVKNISCFN